MLDFGFIGVTTKFGEFGDFPSLEKFGLSYVIWQMRHIIGPMKANIKAIMGKNMFDHVSYIILYPKVILLDIPKYLVDLLVSLHHNYFNAILGLVSLGYPRCRLLDRHLVIR